MPRAAAAAVIFLRPRVFFSPFVRAIGRFCCYFRPESRSFVNFDVGRRQPIINVNISTRVRCGRTRPSIYLKMQFNRPRRTDRRAEPSGMEKNMSRRRRNSRSTFLLLYPSPMRSRYLRNARANRNERGKRKQDGALEERM